MSYEFDFSYYTNPPEPEAAAVGCSVLYPDINQLQLDIDTDERFEYFQKRWGTIASNLDWGAYYEILQSKSGNRHIIVTCTKRIFTDSERVMYQAMLGSDPIREALNAARIACGVKQPIRLFRPILKGDLP